VVNFSLLILTGECMLQCVKTHLRNMVVVPEMIGSIVGVYNGKTYNQVEIKVTILCISQNSSLIIVWLLIKAGDKL